MTTESTLRHAVITDEMVDEVRSRIGKVMRPRTPYFNTAATADTIRHFVDGIADQNPLYRDPAYAARSAHGRLVAPPNFLYSVYWPCGGMPGMGMGMPGIHAWHAGNDWEWLLPILEGDHIDYQEVITDLVEKQGRVAGGRTFLQHSLATYTNQRGEVVARGKGWMVRAERQAAKEAGKNKEIKHGSYDAEQMREIMTAYDSEQIRGATPRYWEDVRLGEELQPVVKGPLSMRDIFAWVIGAGSPFLKAHKNFYDWARRHPTGGMVDSQTGQIDVPEMVHMEQTRAEEIGISTLYDYGAQRFSWLINLLTHWQGDAGFLRTLYGELRGFNMVGDTTWLRGRVTGKRVAPPEHLVDIECWAENQRGEITLPAKATVRLPSRSAS